VHSFIPWVTKSLIFLNIPNYSASTERRVIAGNPFPAAHYKAFQCFAADTHAKGFLDISGDPFVGIGIAAYGIHSVGQPCVESCQVRARILLLLAWSGIMPMIELRQLTWKFYQQLQDHAPAHGHAYALKRCVWRIRCTRIAAQMLHLLFEAVSCCDLKCI